MFSTYGVHNGPSVSSCGAPKCVYPRNPGEPADPRYPHYSGYPLLPANAPIVSQNYTGFTATRPDPAKTWDQHRPAQHPAPR